MPAGGQGLIVLTVLLPVFPIFHNMLTNVAMVTQNRQGGGHLDFNAQSGFTQAEVKVLLLFVF